ncbi:MAG: phosphatidate cytidylyltransferase [Alphaproteobacteria bacterium]
MKNNFKRRVYTSLALLAIVFLMFASQIILTYFLIILGILSILEFIKMIKKIILNRTLQLSIIIYVYLFCFMFFFFSSFIQLKIILLIFLIGCISSDIGGYAFGKTFKGPKITKISPNKTYAGALGSIIFTIFIMSLLFFYIFQNFNYKIILVALVTSIFCQIGDLIFSFLKRKAKTKDTGKLLPGHGGILDRIDGIYLGMPLGLYTFILFYH